MGLLANLLPAAIKRWLLASLGGSNDDRYARVFHASPDWIAVTRLRDGMIVDANQGFETISGYQAAEVLGHPMGEFKVWTHPAQRDKLVVELLRNGVARDTLVQLRRRDGTVRDCMVNASLITLEGQTETHAVWIARDVTDQNAVHEQFKAAFQLTPDFMSISRLSDGTYVEVNAAFERVTGLKREDTLGRTSIEMGVWHDPQAREALVQAFQHTGSLHEYFILINGCGGQVREALVNAATFEARGERYMIALLRDVTDDRVAARALQESEARFARLFEESPLPMCYSSDSDGFATTQWNRAWFSAFGFDPATAQGKSGNTLGIWVHPEDRERLLSRAVHGEDLSNVEVPLLRANGEPRWISILTRTFKEPQRTLVLFTYFDITERRRAQEEVQTLNTELEDRVAQRTADLERANLELSLTLANLKTAKDQLVQSEKLAALGALVAGVAHELNTPIGNGLTVASSLQFRVEQLASLMETGMKRSDLQGFLDDTRMATDILTRNLSRAGTLVSSFKQVAVDQTSSQRRPFALSVLVSEILLTLNPAIRTAGCAVTVHVDETLQMDSYPGPLGQVLTNLINNAIVHGFPQHPEGTITITARAQPEEQLTLQVQDDGCGIQKADLVHVFEPFFTTRMGQGGSGLGLHIVHNLVTGVLGGYIEAQSIPGQGATFTVTLPRSAPQRSNPQAALADA
ncbi:MAG: PAS domain S-box protein [Betaproteobacteria bacterium]|nr:PAS domain S-box protein [Betaproteobacteria bacterium]